MAHLHHSQSIKKGVSQQPGVHGSKDRKTFLMDFQSDVASPDRLSQGEIEKMSPEQQTSAMHSFVLN